MKQNKTVKTAAAGETPVVGNIVAASGKASEAAAAAKPAGASGPIAEASSKAAELALAKLNEQKKKITGLGEEIIGQTVKLGEKYLELCTYIRTEGVGPRVVSETLAPLGFHKVRISEINRVAGCPDALWNQYKGCTIGFKKVLDLARGNVVRLITAGTPLEEKDEAIQRDFVAAALDDKLAAPMTPEEKAAAVQAEERGPDKAELVAKMARLAKAMLLTAPNIRGKFATQWETGNGWKLVLQKAGRAKGVVEKE